MDFSAAPFPWPDASRQPDASSRDTACDISSVNRRHVGANTTVAIEPPGTYLTLDLDAMIVLLGHASHYRPVPLISIASLSENSRASFERHILGTANCKASNVGANDEVFYIVADFAVGNVCQDRVEKIQFPTSSFVLDNPAILS